MLVTIITNPLAISYGICQRLKYGEKGPGRHRACVPSLHAHRSVMAALSGMYELDGGIMEREDILRVRSEYDGIIE